MSDSSLSSKLTFARRDDETERLRIYACNRVLLYARGLDLDAKSGLGLAKESLRRAGPDCDLEEVFRHMHVILHEYGVDPGSSDTASLSSFPPLSRASMVSRGEHCLSFSGWIARGVRCVLGAVLPRKAALKPVYDDAGRDH